MRKNAVGRTGERARVVVGQDKERERRSSFGGESLAAFDAADAGMLARMARGEIRGKEPRTYFVTDSETSIANDGAEER